MTTRAPLLAGQKVAAKKKAGANTGDAKKPRKLTPDEARERSRIRRQKKRLAAGPRRLEEAFETYHTENPGVFEMFCRYAFELKAMGLPKGSAPMVFERIRWEFATNGDLKGQHFKASNDYRAYYARLAMDTYPEHFGGWFRVSMTTSQARVHARRR